MVPRSEVPPGCFGRRGPRSDRPAGVSGPWLCDLGIGGARQPEMGERETCPSGKVTRKSTHTPEGSWVFLEQWTQRGIHTLGFRRETRGILHPHKFFECGPRQNGGAPSGRLEATQDARPGCAARVPLSSRSRHPEQGL